MKKLIIAILLHLLIVPVFSQKSSLRIFQKTFKTYMYSDPDPVPHPQSNIYPYFRFDGYTDEPVDKDWTIVELENEWIKLHITPEIGGKIWGAWEKSTGFPFVYANDVVKFRDVAMRGAWTSGGIEFNFGDIGHAPTVATPVDWTTRENPDGSVSCFVGALDLSSRTRWMVEINLPADKAYFTTRSRWYNCTPFETSYYHWMNGGFRAEGDLEFCFPGTNYIGHEGELHTWPIDEKGRDLSRYKNNDFGSYKSYHVLGEPTDWFGGYWHDDDMGMVHYSPYADKLGKKIWIWGLSRQGYIWEDLLTDNSGQYVELQSGRLFNQAAAGSINSPFKHVAFKPYTTDEWTEYWYPVKGTGGIDWAGKQGAIKIEEKGDSVVFKMITTETIDQMVTIESKNFPVDTLFTGKLKLAPMEVFEFKQQLKSKKRMDKGYSIRLGDELITINKRSGGYGKNYYNSPTDFDWETEYGLYLMGKDLMNQRRYNEAIPYFEKCLEKNPYNLPALGEMAEIQLRLGMSNASNYCIKALSVNIYDPKINFIEGVIHYGYNSYDNAIEYFGVAALEPQYRSASCFYLAKIYFKLKDYNKAKYYAKASIDSNGSNYEASNLLIIIERLTGGKKDAIELINNTLKSDPFNYVAHYEKYLLLNDMDELAVIPQTIKGEMAVNSYLEASGWYYDLWMFKESEELLNLSPPHPEVDLAKASIAYWTGKGEKGFVENVNKAIDGSLYMPDNSGFYISDLKVEGIKESWKYGYYSGLFYWQNSQFEEAKQSFNSLANTPDYPPFYLAKADLFKDDPAVALAALERAWELDPTAWRTAVRLANFHLENGNPAKALEYAEAGQKAYPKHSPMGIVYAKTLNANGLYERCANFLKGYKVLPAEGAYETHDIWREANLHVALAKMTAKKWKDALPWLDAAMAWPENLGSGKPYFPDERLPMWMKAHCFKQLKRQGEAGAASDYLFSYKNPDEPPTYLGEFLTALALRDAGKNMEAQQRLAAAPVGNTPAALQDWCKKTIDGEKLLMTEGGLGRDWKVVAKFLALLSK